MIKNMKASGRPLYLIPWLLALFFLLLFFYFPGGDLKRFRTQKFSVILTDRNGTELQVLPLDEGLRREYVDWDDIPGPIRRIFLQSEDKYFMAHPGVDPLAVIRAFFQNSRQNRIVSGASTVTMQLARILNPHQGGYGGKLKEMLTALRYEANFSKKQIFSAWISSLPYGRNIEGVACASRVYFGCTAAGLSPEQAVMLSVIPRSPRMYSPENGEDLLPRRTLEVCRQRGMAASAEAINRVINNASKNSRTFFWPFEAEHYCNYVVGRAGRKMPRKGSLRTSLDSDLQHHIEYIIREKVFSASEYRISNAAALVINPKNRHILAWVGSVDYFSEKSLGMNDGVLARTQPGSTLKPFLYELALENGFTAATLLPDVPMDFGRGELYMPMNFNNRFNGPVRLRVALASSLNIPAVYTLERLGVSSFIERLKNLGFMCFDKDNENYGLGLALGGADVSLFELVNAYCSFADGGRYAFPVWNPDRRPDLGKEVMDPLCVSVIQDILSDPIGRVTGFGHFGTAARIKRAMIKTGTSNQFNNIWAVGVTPEYTAGVWMGNFTGETIIGKPGSSLPAQAVADLLSHLDLEEDFFLPDELISFEICPLSGKQQGEHCTDSITEYFIPGTIPGKCDFHREQGIVYPAEYAGWLEGSSITASTGKSDHKGVHILSPINEARFLLDPYQDARDQQISIEVITGNDEKISLYYDGILAAEGGYYVSMMLLLERGDHILEAVSGEDRDMIHFTVQ